MAKKYFALAEETFKGELSALMTEHCLNVLELFST